MRAQVTGVGERRRRGRKASDGSPALEFPTLLCFTTFPMMFRNFLRVPLRPYKGNFSRVAQVTFN